MPTAPQGQRAAVAADRALTRGAASRMLEMRGVERAGGMAHKVLDPQR